VFNSTYRLRMLNGKALDCCELLVKKDVEGMIYDFLQYTVPKRKEKLRETTKTSIGIIHNQLLVIGFETRAF
jgi:hypothetical protein